MILIGDGSLDAFFSWLWERPKVFWTSHVSGYLMETIIDNKVFKEAVNNVKNGQKLPKRAKTAKRLIFKGDSSLDTLIRVYGRD